MYKEHPYIIVYMSLFGLSDLFVETFQLDFKFKLIYYTLLGIISIYFYKILDKEENTSLSRKSWFIGI